jgi:hypothetical protein
MRQAKVKELAPQAKHRLAGQERAIAFPYVLGAFVGMIAGMLLGTLVEFILKVVLAPAHGRCDWPLNEMYEG